MRLLAIRYVLVLQFLYHRRVVNLSSQILYACYRREFIVSRRREVGLQQHAVVNLVQNVRQEVCAAAKELKKLAYLRRDIFVFDLLVFLVTLFQRSREWIIGGIRKNRAQPSDELVRHQFAVML